MSDINERLRTAVRNGFEAEIKSLLRKPGCDVLYKDVFGMTVLMYAAWNGKEGCVSLLLPESDALAQDDDGVTALMSAAYNGYDACVKVLLPVSDIHAKDSRGFTASMLAQKRGRRSIAQLIDAYTLALSERTSIGVAVSTLPPRGRATPRV